LQLDFKKYHTQDMDGKSTARKVVESIVPDGIAVDHNADENTLLDVHVGNPLRRITKLLEDIKKQKAFSFTLKGSLGIAGIALIVTTFGIFGGTKALCSKGTQSHIGVLRELSMKEPNDRPYIVDRVMIIWDALTGKDFSHKDRNRMILIEKDDTTIHITERVAGLSLTKFELPVIVTGDYDNCSRTLFLQDIQSIEQF
jgi:hypothetical protein